MLRVAVSPTPSARGVNVTLIVQLLPLVASVLEVKQEPVVALKSVGLAPVTVMGPTVKGVDDVFVTVML